MTLRWRNLWADTAPWAAWEYGRYRQYTRLHWAIWWVRATLDWWQHGRALAVQREQYAVAEREEFRQDHLRFTMGKFERAPLHALAISHAGCKAVAEAEWDDTYTALVEHNMDAAIGWDPVARVYRPVPVSWFPPIPGRDR